MSHSWNPRRRRFLEAAVAGGAAGAAVSCGGKGGAWRVLTDDEAETAAAVCDQFIPSDEFPGAVQAGAVDYIDRQLSGHFRKHRETYRKGLAAFNANSQRKFGKRFAEIPPEGQIELLKAAEKAKDPFFALILSHTMQSYYGDPRHGGNRDEAGYRSIGITSTPVRGRSKHDLTRPESQGVS